MIYGTCVPVDKQTFHLNSINSSLGCSGFCKGGRTWPAMRKELQPRHLETQMALKINKNTNDRQANLEPGPSLFPGTK